MQPTTIPKHQAHQLTAASTLHKQQIHRTNMQPNNGNKQALPAHNPQQIHMYSVVQLYKYIQQPIAASGL